MYNCLKCKAVVFFQVLFVSTTHFCCSIRSRSSSILLLSSSSLLSLSSSSLLRFSSSFCNRSRSSSSRRLRSSSSLLQHPLNEPFQHSYNPRMSYFQHAVTCLLPAQRTLFVWYHLLTLKLAWRSLTGHRRKPHYCRVLLHSAA